MTNRAATRVSACIATLCCVFIGPVASASASSESIRAALVSYLGKIDTAESHVQTALNEYKVSNDPAGVQQALSGAIAVMNGMEFKVERQAAVAPRVKEAKTKVEKGLQKVIVGYEELAIAYGERAANPQAAVTTATRAVKLVKQGGAELREGVNLLG